MGTEKKTSLLHSLQKQNGLIQTEVFRSACADIELCICGISKGNSVPCYRLLGYDEGQNEILIFEKVFSVKEDGSFSYVHSFDPVSLAVYQNSVSFRVCILSMNEISDFTLTKLDLNELEQDTNIEGTNKTRKKRGPHALKNVLFVGNSILLGMENIYGMCASSPKKDYAYLVSEEIKKAYPDCKFFKLHGSGMEHSESLEAFEDVFYKSPNVYTGHPVIDSLTPDLDLIILQITDNVNTEKKTETFHKTAELLLQRIRERCPHAELLWVYGWYYKRALNERLLELIEQYDVEPVDLRPFRYKANEAMRGMLYESADGSMKAAKELWLTHPGDNGMKAIADKIISVLKDTALLP